MAPALNVTDSWTLYTHQPPASASPGDILEALRRMWQQNAQAAQPGEDVYAVTRAASMSLVALVTTEDAGTMETLRRAVAAYPGRVVAVTVSDVTEPTADVSAECVLDAHQERHVCSEIIALQWPQHDAQTLPSIIAPLFAEDLPRFLYSSNLRVVPSKLLSELVNIVDRVIIDTGAAGLHDLQTVHNMLRSGVAVSDLNWSRLTGWREAVSGILADKQCKTELSRGAKILVRENVAAANGKPLAALLLAGWIATRVGGATQFRKLAHGYIISTANLEIVVDAQFVSHSSGIADVTLRFSCEDVVEIKVANIGDGLTTIQAQGPKCPPVAKISEAAAQQAWQLLVGEMRYTGRDAGYEAAVTTLTQHLAGANS